MLFQRITNDWLYHYKSYCYHNHTTTNSDPRTLLARAIARDSYDDDCRYYKYYYYRTIPLLTLSIRRFLHSYLVLWQQSYSQDALNRADATCKRTCLPTP